jgi:RNA polymerase sigma factor (sigma-70 family)
LAEAETTKKTIIEANLRLVVSIAGKHAAGGANFLELVSKGNFALIKAVEEFDYTKGVRFSKIASLNIAKEYAKVSGKSTELTREKAGSLANILPFLKIAKADSAVIERARHSLVQVVKDELDQREQYIILNHFGLVGSLIRKKKKTLQQIGQDLGLTKERVRQLELIALQKLRNSLSIEEFELLTG